MTVEVADSVTWRPTGWSALAINVIAVPIFVAGLFLFGGSALIFARGSSITLRLGLAGLLGLIGLIILLAILHEAIHGLAMWRFGAHPRFGAAFMAKTLPVLYASAPGYRFTRGQYLVIAAGPAVVVSLVGIIACATPIGIYLVLPFAGHLAACMGDALAIWHLLRQPRDTVVEDLLDGLRFHRPTKGLR